MLAGRGICVHSVLHSEFNHVGARQADGVLRRAAFTVMWLRVRTTAAATYSGFQDAGTFGLGAAGAYRVWLRRSAIPVSFAQKIVQRAAVEALQRRPEGEVREVVVD